MGHKNQLPQPTNRKGIWYLIRRVPKAFAHRDRRKFVSVSTGIPVRDDPRAILARQRARELDAQLQAFWRSPPSLDMRASQSSLRAIQQAQTLDLPVITTQDAVDLEVSELWQRFVRVLGNSFPAVVKSGNDELKTAARLVFGVKPTPKEKRPVLKVTGMIDEYQRINATEIAAKSPLQRRRWLQQRQAALDLFIRLIGEDCPVETLTTEHTHTFRAHWQDRVLIGEVTSASANREMRQLSGPCSAIRSFHQLDVKNPFACLNIRGDGDGKRIAFDAAFVRDHFLADGKFANLNAAARGDPSFRFHRASICRMRLARCRASFSLSLLYATSSRSIIDTNSSPSSSTA